MLINGPQLEGKSTAAARAFIASTRRSLPSPHAVYAPFHDTVFLRDTLALKKDAAAKSKCN